MGRVLNRDGDLKDGLQLRLMDPSTGEPYHEWYKYTGSEIVKIIQAEGNRRELARLSLEIPAARQMTKDAVYLATGLDAPDGLRAGTELPPWVPARVRARQAQSRRLAGLRVRQLPGLSRCSARLEAPPPSKRAPATPPPCTISPVPPLNSCQDCLSKLSCQMTQDL